MRFRRLNSVVLMGMLVTTTLLMAVSKSFYSPPFTPKEVVKHRAIKTVGGSGMSQASADQRDRDKLASADPPLIQDAPNLHERTTNVGQSSSPTLILLLSSTPRSGSTFSGELISTHESTVYFFEPLHKIKDDPCVQDAECVSSYLAEKFACNVSDEFQRWIKAKTLFLSFFSGSSRQCRMLEKEKQACYKNIDLNKECLESHSRLIKVIRARISSVLPLLKHFPDLKIVHLHRDPRGFMKSIKLFKNWVHESSSYCEGLAQDFVTFNDLKKSSQYSEQIYQLSYENLSRDPVATTRSLFKFLFGSDELEASTLAYLETHTKNNVDGAMSTLKDSAKAAEAWRYSIREKVLQEVENDPQCRASIQYMNHRLFGSRKNTTNENISLYLTGN